VSTTDVSKARLQLPLRYGADAPIIVIYGELATATRVAI
jgi:hypothetical protein